MKAIPVFFNLHGTKHAYRRTSYIPRQGDNLQLSDGYYRVLSVAWFFDSDQMNPRQVIVHIQKIGEKDE